MKNSRTKLSYALYTLLATVFLTSCGDSVVDNDDLYKVTEQAYFEGQKDALNNDIRIKRNQDSCWIWTKSPWDNSREPKFNPSFECE